MREQSWNGESGRWSTKCGNIWIVDHEETYRPIVGTSLAGEKVDGQQQVLAKSSAIPAKFDAIPIASNRVICCGV